MTLRRLPCAVLPWAHRAVFVPQRFASTMAVSFDVLRRQDDVTSESACKLLAGDAAFEALAGAEGTAIITRDREDEDKLAAGIEISISKGVLERLPSLPATTTIRVEGKTADQVADELMAQLPGPEGCVLVLQGLSGTGKGTTVKKLQQRLPKCMCWSNGNVFRTLTYLVNAHCEKTGTEFSADVLTAELVADCMRRVSFEKCGDEYDVVIDGTQRVSEIANTTLKVPAVSGRVPTVAGQTQGEVIHFAAKAVKLLQAAGYNVILEGRAQTLNYIPTPHRFELAIQDTKLLGQRRAAQRVMAHALTKVTADTTPEDVTAALIAAPKDLQ